QVVTLDEGRQHGLARGAFAFVTKSPSLQEVGDSLDRMRDFATERRRRLLVVEDDEAESLGISELLGEDDIDLRSVRTGSEALAALDREPWDCMVLDLRLPDMSGFEVLERIGRGPHAELPVVVFTGKDLSPEEDARLH